MSRGEAFVAGVLHRFDAEIAAGEDEETAARVALAVFELGDYTWGE